ncbi:MAG: hypothetical protein WDO56_03910 [Gammaproteobacteria bacterium]
MPSAMGKFSSKDLTPWGSSKRATAIVLNRAAHGGDENFWQRYLGIGTTPYGTLKTIRWTIGDLFQDPKMPTGSLEVARSESDPKGFALYGMVRTGGTSVIPLSAALEQI